MKGFKVDNFCRENCGKSFPGYRELSEIELESVQRQIIAKLGLEPGIDLLCLVEAVAKRSTPLKGVNAMLESFDFSRLLSGLEIDIDDSVYINWYRYDEIDEMKLCDFSKYFGDIWYSSADDIDIFDEAFTWMVSIRHDGVVSEVDINQKKSRKITNQWGQSEPPPL